MNKENVEIVSELEKPINGLRKGMTKKKLITSMSEDNWKRLDQEKEAEERKIKNKYAYKLFIESDQMRIQLFKIRQGVDKNVINILQSVNDIKKNRILLEKETTKKNDKGIEMDPEELRIEIMFGEFLIEGILLQVKLDLAKIYAFVGSKGLDGKIIFTEEEYNVEIEKNIAKLKKTRYNIT